MKVSTEKVIEALQNSLAERKKRKAEYDKEQKAYEKAKEDANKKLLALIKTGKVSIGDIDENHFSWRRDRDDVVTFSVEVKVAKKLLGVPEEAPENPFGYSYKEDNEAIENAIRILKMTDEETVNTSTYSAVAKFI